MAAKLRVQSASVQGAQHKRIGLNNQDAVLTYELALTPPGGETVRYQIGLIADGCTNVPAFSCNEVGANLTVVYCLSSIQWLLRASHKLEEIPELLYPMLRDFLLGLVNSIMPAGTLWQSNIQFSGPNAERNKYTAAERLRIDYFAATVAGFIDDGTTLVTLRADDGIMIVNDSVQAIDLNNRPHYPVTTEGGAFSVTVHSSAEVPRLVLATDGLKELFESGVLKLGDALLSTSNDQMSVQYGLNKLASEHGELMYDDCSLLVRERIEE